PFNRSSQSGRSLQSEHPGIGFPAHRAQSGLLRFWSPSGSGISNWRYLGRAGRLRCDFLRAVRYYDTIHDAAISVYSNRGPAVSGQCECRVYIVEWTDSPGHSAKPELRSRAGSLRRRSHKRFGLFPATESDYWKDSRGKLEFRGCLSRFEEYATRDTGCEHQSASDPIP